MSSLPARVQTLEVTPGADFNHITEDQNRKVVSVRCTGRTAAKLVVDGVPVTMDFGDGFDTCEVAYAPLQAKHVATIEADDPNLRFAVTVCDEVVRSTHGTRVALAHSYRRLRGRMAFDRPAIVHTVWVRPTSRTRKPDPRAVLRLDGEDMGSLACGLHDADGWLRRDISTGLHSLLYSTIEVDGDDAYDIRCKVQTVVVTHLRN